MLNVRFLIREMLEARNQAGIFILCVALSITSLVALNSFKGDVHQSITGDARALHGGDVIIHSHYDFSPALLAAVNTHQQVLLDRVRTWSFYSVVRNGADESTLFSNIKAVGPSYPLYGEVVLASGESFGKQLEPGAVIVGQELLEKLDLQVGSFLNVGNARLRIVDVIVRESTRPVDILSFGPRVFVAAADLVQMDLVKKGSRVEYEMLLKVKDEAAISSLTTELKKSALPDQERVSSYKTARSGLKRFFDNLLFSFHSSPFSPFCWPELVCRVHFLPCYGKRKKLWLLPKLLVLRKNFSSRIICY